MFTSMMSLSKKIKSSENEIKSDDLYVIRKEVIIAAYL